MNILLTGGASGLGKALAEHLAAPGSHRLWITFCHSEAAARELEATHPNLQALHCDFADPGSLDALLERLPTLELDALVHNALAAWTVKHFHKLKPEALRAGFEGNVMPVVRLTQAALKGFRKKRFGRIVTVLTAALYERPPIGWSEYLAGKAYLWAMTRCWAVENAAFGITANCVSPGFLPTDLHADDDPRLVEEWRNRMPLQRFVEPEEVARAVAFFLEGPASLNGENLLLNQGQTLHP